MMKIPCIAFISIVMAMSGCTADPTEDPEDSDEALSETESEELSQCPFGYV